MRVKTRPLLLSSSSRKALQSLGQYELILLTSKQAAWYFARAIKTCASAHHPIAAAVGPVTARAARKAGFKVIAVGNSGADALVKKLPLMRGMRILFPRSAIANKKILRELRARGAHVRVIPLYTTEAATLPAAVKRQLLTGTYCSIFFKSPSAVRGFINQFSVAQQGTILAMRALCIGPTTAHAARTAGFINVVVKDI